MMTCTCGGTYFPIEGLEGYTCDKCGHWVPQITTFEKKDNNSLFTEDKLKGVRGLPVNRITIGSESKGRLEISIPIFATYDEQKNIIDMQLSLLQYTKDQIQAKGLDIMPKR